MSDPIDRQAAIDLISQHTFYDDYDDTDKCSLLDGLRELPSAQPEKRTEERTETHACDCINRQAAIDKVDRIVKVNHLNPDMVWFTPNGVKTLMEDLPSAEPDDEEANYWHEKANSYEQTFVKLAQSIPPEIIRCKDCEDYQTDWETSYPNRHYCAAMDLTMPEDGFCSYAERREE